MTYTDILSQLISFDTTTAKDTLDAVHWVRHYLENAGMTVRLIYNAPYTRASVVATFAGNPTDKNVIFCGHMDVVPASPNTWETDPFVMTEKDGLLFGRGVADMKGGIAVLLSLVPEFIKRRKNFTIILTHNEEIAGTGITEVLNDAAVQKILSQTRGCLVLEPTLSRVVLGHKTATSGSVTLKGKPAHSSNPKLAVNALAHAVELYNIFYGLAARLSDEQDADFEVPYSVADILILNGGTAVNVIPDSASFTYTCRFISEEAETLFLAAFKQRARAYVEQIAGLSVHFGEALHLPALEMAQDDNFVQDVLTVFPFAPHKKVSFATEAGHFSKLGIPTVVCGPGNIEQAHQDNEFIDPSQLAFFYEKLNRWYR